MSLEQGPNTTGLTLSSPSEVAILFLKQQYFTSDKVQQYLLGIGTRPEEVRQIENNWQAFLESDIVRGQFATYWEAETSPKWKDRTAEEALYETTFHSLSTIHAMAEDHLYDGGYEAEFSNMDQTEIESIKRYSSLASRMFSACFVHPRPHSLPRRP